MKTLFPILLSLIMAVLPLGCTDYSGGSDAGLDAGDPGDAGAGDGDAGEDAGGDAGSDEDVDAGPDAGADAGGDEGGDAGGDTGGDKGPGLEPECTTAEECTLYSDRCSCVALAPGEQPPPCDIPECFTDHCTAIGIDHNSSPYCTAGRCIIGFDCDHTQVMCDGPTPACNPGEIARVSGACWYGSCVPTSECALVPSCADCDSSFYVCIRNVAHLPSHHCVEIPADCSSDRTCACMGGSVCVHPFYSCRDSASPNEIDCDCPICSR